MTFRFFLVAMVISCGCSGAGARSDPAPVPVDSGIASDGNSDAPEALPPWTSGARSLERVWAADLSHDGIGGMRIFGPFLTDTDDILLGGALDGTWSMFGEAAFTTKGYDVVAAALDGATGAPRWTKHHVNDAFEFGVSASGSASGMLLNGSFRGTLDLGAPAMLTGVPDPSIPDSNTQFMALLNATGSVTWARTLPYTNGTYFLPDMRWNATAGIGIAASGSWAKVDLGGGAFSAIMGSILVGRLDTKAMHVWSRQITPEGFGAMTVSSHALAGDGRLVVAGKLHGRATIDGLVLDSGKNEQPYVVMFQTDGTLAWGRLATASEQSPDMNVEIIANDVVAHCVGTGVLDLGGGAQGVAGTSTGHVARYASDGAVRWSRVLGGPGMGRFVVADQPGGGLAIGGSFTTNVDTGDTVHVSAGRSDIVVMSLDQAGATVWSTRMGNEWDQGVDQLAIHNSGDLLLRTSALSSTSPGNGAIVFSRWRVLAR